MDYTRWAAMQPQNPNLYATQYSSYYSQNPKVPNPNPNVHLQIDPQRTLEPNYSNAGTDPTLRPPGADQYLSLSSFPHSHGAVGYAAHQPGGVTFAHYQTVDTGSVAVQQYGATLYVPDGTVPQSGTHQLVAAIPSSTVWNNPTIRPHGPWKKGPKKTKIAQSAWCEVCKVECNTRDVLDQHKLGKKHMKNLEKLKAAVAPTPAPVASAVPNNTVIGPQENPSKVQKKKKAVETAEDLETKRRKILDGGAAVNAVRSCATCNVVCNSETVFKFHLAGAKHASMMKKHAYGAGLATAT